MLVNIKAFFHGIVECRSDVTANYDDQGAQAPYERGRSLGMFLIRRKV